MAVGERRNEVFSPQLHSPDDCSWSREAGASSTWPMGEAGVHARGYLLLLVSGTLAGAGQEVEHSFLLPLPYTPLFRYLTQCPMHKTGA